MKTIKSVLRLLAVPATLSLCACAAIDPGHVNLEGSDHSVTSLGGELRLNLNEHSTRSGKTTKSWLEYGVINSNGAFTQTLTGSETIGIDGSVISGPATLSAKLDVREHYFRYVKDVTLHHNLGLSVGGGIKGSDVDVTVATSSQRLSSESGGMGGYNILASLRYSPMEHLNIEAILDHTFSITFFFPFYKDWGYITDKRLQLCYLGIENLHLCAGHRFWSARIDNIVDHAIVNADLSGPVAFIRYEF